MVDRIQKLIQLKKLSSSKFADQIGVPRSTISHILSGRNNPSLDLLQKILDTYTDIKTEWLIRGEGPIQTGSQSLFSEADFYPEVDTVNSIQEAGKARFKDRDLPSHRGEISEDSDTGTSTGRAQEGNEDTYGDLDNPLSQQIKKEAKKDNANDQDGSQENFTESARSYGTKNKAMKVIIIYSDGSFSEHTPV